MTLDIATHKNVLIKILKDIYTDSTIGPLLGFKGGTAAYFFYNLDRFSVDLDFDLLDVGKKDYVFERIKKILEKYGLIKEVVKKRFNLFYVLSYEDKVPGGQNIKVEINCRNFDSKYEVKTYLGISMKVMVREDMFAHKLCALFERVGKTNRDIYDVWFFLNNNWPINKEIVEKRTKMPFKKFLKKCIGVLEKLSDRGILAGMGELFDEAKKRWVKENLRKEVIFQLKLMLDNSSS